MHQLKETRHGRSQVAHPIENLWGAVVTLGGAALTLGHYALTPADAALAVDLLSGIAGAIGGLIAIYGRVVATKKIGA
jgi:uncharacterized membrane protein HdeD (DUF308 family)